MTIGRLLHKILAREAYHPVLTYPLFLLRVQIVRARYRRTLRRLREKVARGEKLRVVFLSMDTSKWKCQPVYERMRARALFDPVVGLTITDEDENLSDAEVNARMDASRAFFTRLGNRTCPACDVATRRAFSADALGADIVFYQVPWGNLGEQKVWNVSRTALTCYVPYAVENMEWKRKRCRFDFHHTADFHQLLWTTFDWSEEYVRWLLRAQFPWEWGGSVIPAGHPSLDAYRPAERSDPQAPVIYAPHFSFPWNGHQPIMNHSTFQWSGRSILEYAQRHPEIKWIFKPHPKLRSYVVDVGFMTRREVDDYYAAWEKLGTVCYDGDYAELFARSRAMVTDSGSFLFEYMPTGNPLIRLIPDNILVVPNPPARAVCDTFYNCHSSDEMFAAFRLVLEGHADPKRDVRLAESRRANLIGNDCTARIMDYLCGRLGLARQSR